MTNPFKKFRKWWKKRFGPVNRYGFCRWGHDYGEAQSYDEQQGTNRYIGDQEITKKVRVHKSTCKKCKWTDYDYSAYF